MTIALATSLLDTPVPVLRRLGAGLFGLHIRTAQRQAAARLGYSPSDVTFGAFENDWGLVDWDGTMHEVSTGREICPQLGGPIDWEDVQGGMILRVYAPNSNTIKDTAHAYQCL